jgi:predicted phage terminase large subunit-like protein
MILQSWDTANKCSELSDYSVCTTWGVQQKHVYLLHVFRRRLDYPSLKRAVCEQAEAFGAKTILIEDRASGTQLLQELTAEGMHTIQGYQPALEKIMRMHSVSGMIENGFVHLPENAEWLAAYLYEMAVFPNGKFDDQVDSTSQSLDWFKATSQNQELGLITYLKKSASAPEPEAVPQQIPESRPCANCHGTMTQRIPGGLRCFQCGAQWLHPDYPPRAIQLTRADVLRGRIRFP